MIIKHLRGHGAVLLVLILAAVLFAPFKLSADLAATPAANDDSDLIFNYAEATYPQFLAPAGAVSQTAGDYYYRYYAGTNAYLATANGRFLYLGPASNNQILDLGASSEWLSTSLRLGVGYSGPLVNAHMHGEMGIPVGAQIAELDRAGVGRTVLLLRSPDAAAAYASHPDRIMPFLQEMRRDQGGTEIISVSSQALATGLYYGIGEVGLRHFQTPGRPRADIPGDNDGMKAICDAAASRGMPVTVHLDIMYVDELERLLQYNRMCMVIWAHVGSVPPQYGPRIVPADIKLLLARHPNLYADLSCLSPNPNCRRWSLLDAAGRLDPAWKDLFESYPDRFFHAVDIFIESDIEWFVPDTKYMRKILGQLSPGTAEKIAYKNLLRVTNAPGL